MSGSTQRWLLPLHLTTQADVAFHLHEGLFINILGFFCIQEQPELFAILGHGKKLMSDAIYTFTLHHLVLGMQHCSFPLIWTGNCPTLVCFVLILVGCPLCLEMLRRTFLCTALWY